MIKLTVLSVAAVCLFMMVMSVHARAQVCASGVYRTGCVGPNGAVVVAKPPAANYYRPVAPYYGAATPYYRAGGDVHCANGLYRAGCAGRRGAVVVRKPY